MANVSDMESRLAHFRSLWRLSFPNSKLLFTGRRNLFFLEQEIDLVFGGASRSAADPYCEVVHLQPFNIAQIACGLRWADPQVRNGILKVAQENEQMFDIVSRPSLLYIVAWLWPELEKLAATGSMTSASVIAKFIEHSYRRQAEKAIGSPGFMSLLEGERRYFHEGTAVMMAVVAGASNQISQQQFTAAIETLYLHYPDDRHILPPAMTEGTPRPLKARLSDSENLTEQVATDVRTHGILVSDMARRGAFRFAHKSFFEVLYAKAAAHSLLDDTSEFYHAIERSVDYSILSGVMSPETLKLFAETSTDRILADSDYPQNPDTRVERRFDVIMGIKGNIAIVRYVMRVNLWLKAEVRYTRYGRFYLMGGGCLRRCNRSFPLFLSRWYASRSLWCPPWHDLKHYCDGYDACFGLHFANLF